MSANHESILCNLHLHAVLSAMEDLLRVDEATRNEAPQFSLCMSVAGGPSAKLNYHGGSCTHEPNPTSGADIVLKFLSPSQVNATFNKKPCLPPLPIWGFHAIGNIMAFQKYSDRMEGYLRASDEDLAKDEKLREAHVRLSFGLLMAALKVLAEHEPASRKSASKAPDGIVQFTIPGAEISAWIEKSSQGGKLAFHNGRGEPPRTADARVEFDSIETALELLKSRLDIMAAVGLGKMKISGLIPLIDSLGLIMDRVPLYLDA